MTSTDCIFNKNIDLSWIHSEVEYVEDGEGEEDRSDTEKFDKVVVFVYEDPCHVSKGLHHRPQSHNQVDLPSWEPVKNLKQYDQVNPGAQKLLSVAHGRYQGSILLHSVMGLFSWCHKAQLYSSLNHDNETESYLKADNHSFMMVPLIVDKVAKKHYSKYKRHPLRHQMFERKFLPTFDHICVSLHILVDSWCLENTA